MYKKKLMERDIENFSKHSDLFLNTGLKAMEARTISYLQKHIKTINY